MKSRIIAYVIVVIVGVAIGVPLTAKFATHSVTVAKLAEFTLVQKKIEQRLGHIEEEQKKMSDAVQKISKLAQAANRPVRPPAEDFSKKHRIDVGVSPVLGDKNAPITIVEFIDFQCPFCARFHPIAEATVNAYPGQVKLVGKNFPLAFHPQARPAAKAAFAAGEQGKYWEMADLLLKNARSLSEAKYEELAKQIGLNMSKFKRDMKEKDAEWEKRIEADLTLGNQVGVRGTPTFYLDGRKTRARTLSGFKKEVDEILKGQ